MEYYSLLNRHEYLGSRMVRNSVHAIAEEYMQETYRRLRNTQRKVVCPQRRI